MSDRDDQEISVTMRRGQWLVILGAAANYDARVPYGQGDGGECLRLIAEAIGTNIPVQPSKR